MSKESRRKRGIEHSEYKKRREAKIEGRKAAKEQFTNNWKNEQKTVAKVIGAIEEYYGDENFHRSAWTSEELLDEYEKIFVKNENFSEIKEDDEIEINRELARRNIPAKIKKSEEPPIALDMNEVFKELDSLF